MEELYIELIALCYKNDKANFIKKITRASVKDIYKFRRATLLVRKINKLKIYFSNINKILANTELKLSLKILSKCLWFRHSSRYQKCILVLLFFVASGLV